jgi:SAM-dependent methyltransferase/uncharacterized membrane protein YbhN (UPF0104 family)
MSPVRSPRSARLRYVLPLVAGVLLASVWVGVVGGEALAGAMQRMSALAVAPMLGLTATWLGLRFLRWQFLLRRMGVRLPIRASLGAYLASVAGTATPAYIGEAVRAVFLRRRFGLPARVTLTALLVERAFDVAAIASLAMLAGDARTTRIGALFLAGTLVVAALARRPLLRYLGRPALFHTVDQTNLPHRFPWDYAVVVLGALSLLAWGVAAALYGVAARGLGLPLGWLSGVAVFTESTLLGAATLLPAGVVATGSVAIVRLQDLGLGATDAVSLVTVVRALSVGVTLAVGIAMLWRELRSGAESPARDVAHFDEIADAYQAQWSEHVWDLLIDRKLTLMAEALGPAAELRGSGIDLGCGLGLQTAEMRRRGYPVVGLEPSVGLLMQKRAGDAPVLAGDALNLPFADGSVAFVYAIGVLHHLPGREAQRRALEEIHRVLRPGGALLVHESNPRNPLFRFYMGYLFPILKRIDEGTEWWIDPRHWARVPGFQVDRVRYFTFLPDFIPRGLMGAALHVERLLERGPTRAYSAHYLAVVRKAGAAPGAAPAPDHSLLTAAL